MAHYVCAGECGGVSEKTGVCRSEDCSAHGESFERCDCGDDTHGGEVGDGYEYGDEEEEE